VGKRKKLYKARDAKQTNAERIKAEFYENVNKFTPEVKQEVGLVDYTLSFSSRLLSKEPLNAAKPAVTAPIKAVNPTNIIGASLFMTNKLILCASKSLLAALIYQAKPPHSNNSATNAAIKAK
jgi:hypothetical protein